MFRSRRSRPLSKQLGAVVLVLTLVLGLWLAPALAQTPIKAPVVLDGQKLFQISSSGEYSAEERADSINSELKNAVKASEPIQVKVEQRNQLPTILLDGRCLLTVTDQDIVPGSTPREQASIWQKRIQEALQHIRERLR